MTGSGYQVSPAALQQAATGIDDTISTLKDMGVEGTADAGRGFSQLELTGMQVGHPGLQNAFSQFCDRWSWGVRTLVQDANQIAAQLGLNAGAYHDAENYASGTFKDLYADALGDPNTTDDQVQSESWSTVLADNPVNDILHPDYSATAAANARADISATWNAEGRDVMNGFEGSTQALADHAGAGQQFAQAENEVFGPAPTPASSASSGEVMEIKPIRGRGN